mmetsp:Transcript_34465/g.101281  ORF Transcript_34465/g.101281 Transcript_34465/m.101281 type:complete len:192 (-) Transcript_34465:51-626(-)
MMRIPPFRGGGGATNERPAANKASSSADASSAKCNSASSSNAQRCSVEDVYKARCSDLEREIVQLKLELAEAKVMRALLQFVYIVWWRWHGGVVCGVYSRKSSYLLSESNHHMLVSQLNTNLTAFFLVHFVPTRRPIADGKCVHCPGESYSEQGVGGATEEGWGATRSKLQAGDGLLEGSARSAHVGQARR